MGHSVEYKTILEELPHLGNEGREESREDDRIDRQLMPDHSI